jgi:hypothetical protein
MELHVFGKIGTKIYKQFGKRNNFISHGVITGEKLFNEINKLDVGIALYNVNDVNKGRTPNKLWIYLALGKPVVVTDIYSIKNWKFPEGFVYKSYQNNNFKNLIVKAYNEDNYSLFKERIAFAKRNTWENRVEKLQKLIKK